MAHDDDDENAYRETAPETFCHAPGERCTDIAECYANKCCQYEPPDQIVFLNGASITFAGEGEPIKGQEWDNMAASTPRGLL